MFVEKNPFLVRQLYPDLSEASEDLLVFDPDVMMKMLRRQEVVATQEDEEQEEQEEAQEGTEEDQEEEHDHRKRQATFDFGMNRR